jgi:hypothetical protein
VPPLGGIGFLAAGVFNLIIFLVWLVLALWVYSDASRRYPQGSIAPLIWALATLIGGILVVILYLLVRPPERR